MLVFTHVLAIVDFKLKRVIGVCVVCSNGSTKTNGRIRDISICIFPKRSNHNKWKHLCGCSPLKTCAVFCFYGLCGLYWSWRRTISNVKLFYVSVCRSQRGLSRCQRWLWGSFTQPFGLGETATPAGKKGYIKLFVSWTVLYQMPSDCLVVLSADVRTAFIWNLYPNARMHT